MILTALLGLCLLATPITKKVIALVVGAYLSYIDWIPFISQQLLAGRGLQLNYRCSHHSVPFAYPADVLIRNKGFTSLSRLQI